MSVFYLVDRERRARLHKAGVNDTSAYIPAILHLLGVTGQEISPDRLDSLREHDVLLAVRTVLPSLPCTVISFAPSQDPMMVPEQKIYGYVCRQDKKLPVFTPICPEGEAGEVLAYAMTEDTDPVPAWTKNGKHHTYAFDLPASVWISGDGFPAPGGKGIFRLGRVPDMRPLPVEPDSSVAYNDEFCHQIRLILLEAGVPMLHTLPPLEDGTVPDFALHFSGDDDACSPNLNLTAACNMESFGLPYHINAMPAGRDRFIMSREQYAEIRSHGCEVALHTDFWDNPYTAEEQTRQIELFREVFGEMPVTNVNHCLFRDGTTAERLLWLEAHGLLADNDKLGEVDPDDANAYNICGYGFGTAFPRYTCTDAAGGNRLIRTMEIPINYYEPRLDSDTFNKEWQMLRYLDESAAHSRITQFFVHPHYLNPSYTHITSTFNALKRIQTYIQEKQFRVWYTTTNTAARFWRDRTDSLLTETETGEYSIRALCPLCVLLPDGAESVRCGDTALLLENRVVSGKAVRIAVIPEAGEYLLHIE